MRGDRGIGRAFRISKRNDPSVRHGLTGTRVPLGMPSAWHAAANAGSKPQVGRAPVFCATGEMPKMSLPPTVVGRAVPDPANARPLNVKPAGSLVTQLNVTRCR